MSHDLPADRDIYLDHAATTPVRPEVRDAMLPFLGEACFGNPSSGHARGRSARAALDGARCRIAEAVGCEPADVYFTSGGTEADNLAVLGGALRARAEERPFRVAVGATEHKAVLDAGHAVEHLGGELMVLPVDGRGLVSPDAVVSALERGLALLSVMWVNNETGVMQDAPAIAVLAARARTPFHTDAVQAVGKVPCRLDGTEITMLTISGHKLGAPKGIGALVLRRHDAVAPLIHGGGQQGGVRPGTENVAGAVGLGVAVELAVREREERMPAVRALRERLEALLTRALPDACVTAAGTERAPHITNVTVPGVDGSALLVHLDRAGIHCSTGSACSTGSTAPSHVLTAMGIAGEGTGSTLRFSLSAHTTEHDVERAMAALPALVRRVRTLTEALRR
jgi:cysteine desulfurase